jgi:2-oxoglutarate ferredoxin oxidoreductase subunit beta
MTSPAPTAPAPAVKFSKKDFQTDQEVRWCPGCGDYAVLNSVLQVFATLNVPREKYVCVSGIGCSSRFPYYVNTFGFHTIHGRAPAIATGIKLANPELEVWIATGDGDGLSIGGNHTIHTLRRNVGVKMLLFNNRIYGLTKGQYSPTSELGKMNKSAPFGTVDQPINPISLALASEATFIGRSVDVYQKHLMDVVKRAAEHKGAAFVEIYQNCNVFNDKTFEDVTNREVRDDQNVSLEHGKPMVFGKAKDRAIRMNGHRLEVFKIGENGLTINNALVHDEHDPTLAYMLSRMQPPAFPVPIGVFRADRLPTLEERVVEQVAAAKKKLGEPNLEKLLFQGDVWEVK